MPRKGLSSRLKHLRIARTAAPPPPVPEEPSPQVRIPGFERIGEFVYRRSETIPGILPPAERSGFIVGADIPDDKLLFFDLETTGLSSGAGTLAFLAGFGRYVPEGFLLEQFFLTDYPGEGEFLQLLSEAVDWDSCFLSYNGRAYDANLLASRGLMNGLRFRFLRHVDLLYLSRRLWRETIGSCSLGNIEAEVLGVSREEDLPGIEVPERWFSFLRTGDAALLHEVFAHHREDILSLAKLLSKQEEILKDPLAAQGIDRRSLGIALLSRGDSRGESLLAAAYRGRDLRAGRLLALCRKRAGDWRKAVDLWRELASMEDDAGVCEELAKYHEHRSRSIDEALLWARKGLAAAQEAGSGRRAADFLARISRLEEKQRRQSVNGF